MMRLIWIFLGVAIVCGAYKELRYGGTYGTLPASAWTYPQK
jgi:hypothetical protein